MPVTLQDVPRLPELLGAAALLLGHYYPDYRFRLVGVSDSARGAAEQLSMPVRPTAVGDRPAATLDALMELAREVLERRFPRADWGVFVVHQPGMADVQLPVTPRPSPSPAAPGAPSPRPAS